MVLIWSVGRARGPGGMITRAFLTLYRPHSNPPMPQVSDPEWDPWRAPHSCGELCGRRLNEDGAGCDHTCLLLCHPGPCPPCPLVRAHSGLTSSLSHVAPLHSFAKYPMHAEPVEPKGPVDTCMEHRHATHDEVVPHMRRWWTRAATAGACTTASAAATTSLRAGAPAPRASTAATPAPSTATPGSARRASGRARTHAPAGRRSGSCAAASGSSSARAFVVRGVVRAQAAAGCWVMGEFWWEPG